MFSMLIEDLIKVFLIIFCYIKNVYYFKNFVVYNNEKLQKYNLYRNKILLTIYGIFRSRNFFYVNEKYYPSSTIRFSF